jgi:hypothetical protein
MRGTVETERSRPSTLRRGDIEVCCEARLLRAGIEGRILCNGSELYAFLFPGDRELWAWADEKRAELKRQGWRPARHARVRGVVQLLPRASDAARDASDGSRSRESRLDDRGNRRSARPALSYNLPAMNLLYYGDNLDVLRDLFAVAIAEFWNSSAHQAALDREHKDRRTLQGRA